jgi:NADH:ubiquinone oxidoreductase subunit F (NADH-binding)
MFYSPVITNAKEAAQKKDFHLFTYVEDPNQYKLETYESHGGYNVWKNVLNSMKPEQVIEEVKKSGLRGRGGAGFGIYPEGFPETEISML